MSFRWRPSILSLGLASLLGVFSFWQSWNFFRSPISIESLSSFGVNEAIHATVSTSDSLTAQLLANDGSIIPASFEVTKGDDVTNISLPNPSQILVPGKYQIYVKAVDGRDARHSFAWAMKGDGIDPQFFNLPPTAEEVLDKRTEHTATFHIEQNKFAAVSYPSIKKNESIVPAEFFGREKNGKFSFEYLPDNTSIVFDLDHPEYTLSQAGSSLTLRFDSQAHGKVESVNSVTYQLSDNTVLRWKVMGGQVVKEIVVTKEGELPNLSFEVSTDHNLSLRSEGDTLRFTNTSGAVVFATQEPFLIDKDGKRLDRPVRLNQVRENKYTFSFNPEGLSYPYILDPTAGPSNPGTTTEDTTCCGTVAITNIANIAASDDVYATSASTASTQTRGYKATNFGFSVTAGATINGVTATVEAKKAGMGGGSYFDTTAKLVKADGSIGSTNKATSTQWGATDAVRTYGSSSDLWGETLTSTDVNDADFGFVSASTSATNTSQLSVDNIQMSVTYTAGNSISGIAYSDAGTTPLTSKQISVSVNGAAAAGTATTHASTGAYSIPAITMAAGDVLTLKIEDETENGVTVTKATGGDLTGINIFQDYLITRCDNSSCSLTNSNLDTADNVADGDITSIYSVSGGALTVAAGKSLYIPSSHTFAPGGDVSVGGNFSNNGTYTKGTEGLTLTGTSTQTLKTNGSQLYALTINGSGGTYTLQDALTTANSLTITAGTLDASATNCSGGSCSITVNASWSNSGTFTARTGTVTATDASGGSTLLINSGGSSFYNLTLDGAGLVKITSALTVSNNLTISAGTLDTSDVDSFAISVGGNWTNTGGTFTPYTNTVTLTSTSGSATLTTNGQSFYNLTQNGSGGTYTLQDALSVSNNLTITAGTLDTKSGSNFGISVGGNWSNAGTFTARSGTVTLTSTSGSATLTSGGSSFYNLTQNGSGGTYTLQDALTTSNNLTITAGTLDTKNASNFGVTVGGTWSRSGTFTVRSATLTLTGTSTFSDTMSFYNLTVNGSGQTVTLGAALTASNNLTITAGTLDVSASSCSAASCSISVGANFSNAGTFTARTGTVTLTSTSAGATLTSGGSAFYNLTQNGSGGTYTLQDALSVSNNLTITAGTLDTKSGSNFGITVTGNFSNSGTFTARSGTVTFNKSSSTQTLKSGSSTFNNITHSGAGTLQLVTNALTISGTLTNSAGTFDLNGINLTTTGATIDNTATIQLQGGETLTDFTNDTNSGTVLYVGTTSYTGLAAGNSYYHLTFNGSGGSWTLNAALTVNGNFTITTGTVDVSAAGCSGASCGITVAGNWSNAGTFTARTGTVTLTSTSGSATITSGGSSFNNLTQNGSGGTYTLQDAFTASGNFTITAGTLDVSASNCSSDSCSVTVGGTWSNSGTFTPRTGTVTLTGTSTFSDTTSFYNITVNGSGKTVTLGAALTTTNNLTITAGTLDVSAAGCSAASCGITVTGNFSNAGTFTARTGTVTFNKSSSTQTLNSGGSTFYRITHSGAGTLQLATSTLTISNTLTNSAGTFDLAGVNLTTTGATIDNTATIQLQGGETVTGFTNDTNSGVVAYNGSSTYSSGLAAGSSYYSLSFTGSGTWKQSATTTINGDLTISSGTFDLNASALTLASTSAFSNSGTLALTGNETLTNLTNDTDSGTILYNGTGSYTGLIVGNTYNNLTFNGSGGAWALTADLSVNGNLTITAGTFNHNGQNLTLKGNLSNSGTISNSSGRTYTLNGTSGQSFAPGSISITNVTISGASGTVTAGSNFTVLSTLSIGSNKTFNLSSYTITAQDTITNAGTITPSTGSLVHTSSGFEITDSNFDTDPAISIGSDSIYLTITDSNRNLDGTTPDTFALAVTCSNDSESRTLTETGNATGVFRTATGLASGLYTGSATNNNGTLSCTNGETISVSYTDAYDNTDTDTATATATTDTIPTAPSSFSGSVNSDTSITWSWTDNSSNEVGFKLYSGSGTLIATIATANATSYTETGLTGSTSYTRKVVAYNVAGNSSFSNSDTETTDASVSVPTAPSSLSGTAASSTSITWSWTDNASNETGFKLYSSADVLIATIASANATSYTETGLTKGTSYSRYVVAYNGDGNSSASNTASATTSSSTVTTPVLVSPASGAVLGTSLPSFTWTVGQGGNESLVSYILTIDSKSYTVPAKSSLASNPLSLRHVDDLFVAEYSRENDGDPNNDSVTVTLKGAAALGDGEHGWSVTARNDAGETKSTGTRGFTIDASLPVITKLLVDGKALGTATQLKIQNLSPVLTVAASDTEGLSQLVVTIERARTVLGVVSSYVAVETKTYILSGTSDQEIFSARSPLSAGEQYRVTLSVKDVADHTTKKSFTLIVLSSQAVAEQAVQNLDVETTPAEEIVETLREVLPESPVSIPDLKSQAILRRSAQAENYNQFLLAMRNIFGPLFGGEAQLERMAAALLNRITLAQHFVRDSLVAFFTRAQSQVATAIRDRAVMYGRPVQVAISLPSQVGQTISVVQQGAKGVLADGQEVRVKQGLANRQLINRQLQSVLQPAQNAASRVALASRQWYETVFETSEPTHITNVQITNLTPTSAVVEWQTNHLSRLTKVNYGKTTSYGQEVISHELTDHHRVELNDLEAGTTYYFEVMNQGRDYVYDAYYTLTTPEEGQTQDEEQVFAPVNVVIVGTSSIQVYKNPIQSSEVIAEVDGGTRFRALQEQGGWISILLPTGAEGWVLKSNVEISD